MVWDGGWGGQEHCLATIRGQSHPPTHLISNSIVSNKQVNSVAQCCGKCAILRSRESVFQCQGSCLVPDLLPDLRPDLVLDLVPDPAPDPVPDPVPDLVPDPMPDLVPDLPRFALPLRISWEKLV